MSLEGYVMIKKIVTNMTRLAEWMDVNRPAVSRMAVSKSDWAAIMKHQTAGVALGIRYTAPPTFKGFELYCVGDQS